MEISKHPDFKEKDEYPLFKEKLPRICYVLGGKDNPLRIGEIVKYEYDDSNYTQFFVNQSGDVENEFGHTYVAGQTLSIIINHPEKIIRRPQFSEDEKALMRLFVQAGFPWFARDNNQGNFFAYAICPEKKEWYFQIQCCDKDSESVVNAFLPQITWENSPFNAAEYLEELK